MRAPGKPVNGMQSAVQERDQRRRGEPQPGIARGRRAQVVGVTHVARADAIGHRFDCAAVGRSVVDHDHARLGAGERCQTPRKPLGATVDRDDDRHLPESQVARWRIGLGEPPVEQPAGEQPLSTVLTHWPAGQPASNRASATIRQRHQPRRGTAEQHLALPAPSESAGGLQAPPRRDRHLRRQGQAVNPPSTGSTAPVSADAVGPHSQTTASAISFGSISRRIRC